MVSFIMRGVYIMNTDELKVLQKPKESAVGIAKSFTIQLEKLTKELGLLNEMRSIS